MKSLCHSSTMWSVALDHRSRCTVMTTFHRRQLASLSMVLWIPVCTLTNHLVALRSNRKRSIISIWEHKWKITAEYLRINSFVALRDLDGLPGASSFPYFFFEDGVGDVAFAKSEATELLESMVFSFDEMLDDTCELVLLFTVCREMDDWKVVIVTGVCRQIDMV